MEAENAKEQYLECLRNHAAKLGTTATDGCCEFTPKDSNGSNMFLCGACGCHRNFHRRIVFSRVSSQPNTGARPLEPIRAPLLVPPAAAAAPPVSSLASIPAAAPVPAPIPAAALIPAPIPIQIPPPPGQSDRRSGGRSKFSLDQKKKMERFATKLGWRKKKDMEEEIERFCIEIGVTKKIFVVWMSNNKPSSSPLIRDLTR